MFFTVYQVTNLSNGKIYLGQHQTKNLDDGYLGSGTLLTRALAKYGREAFRKEILFVFPTKVEMNEKEAELVTEEFCLRDDTYNLCKGGFGGWSLVNLIMSDEERRRISSLGGKTPSAYSVEAKERQRAGARKGALEANARRIGERNHMFGERHSLETLEKKRKNQPKLFGEDNPAYGPCSDFRRKRIIEGHAKAKQRRQQGNQHAM